MNQSILSRNHATGLSTVELLVALAVSSLLMLGVSSIYLDSNRTDRMGSALSRIQETGRAAIDLIAKDVRMAGYQGCMDPESLEINVIASNPPTTNLLFTALRGFEVADATWANGQEFDNTAIEADALVGSDVIAIQRATTEDTQVTGNMTTSNANVQITVNPMGFEKDDIVLIANCENADMFRITNNPNGGGAVTLAHAFGSNTDNRLSALYDDTASIMSFQSHVYFVKDTGRKNARGEAINALYRQRDNLGLVTGFTIEELVEGVDSLQILYGERLGTGNINFVPASSVTDFSQVVSVKIGLLVSSTEHVLDVDDNQTYELPGQNVQPAGASGATVTHPVDKRLRRDFSATINLRNRQ